jgi:hypothetical protein
MQTVVVRWQLITDHVHHGDELAPQLCEKVLDRGRRKALVGLVYHRIGDMFIGREKKRHILG